MFRKSRDIFLIITGFIFQIFMMKVNMKPTSIKLRKVCFDIIDTYSFIKLNGRNYFWSLPLKYSINNEYISFYPSLDYYIIFSDPCNYILFIKLLTSILLSIVFKKTESKCLHYFCALYQSHFHHCYITSVSSCYGSFSERTS